ncbi:MAG: TonB-dependent receptor [Bacteroidia bacterium]|nr:TonB-dependent receptor [Bacteroidia bacterium]
MKNLFTLLLSMTLTLSSWAQHSISGTITDSDGDALQGVSIVEKGTTRGVLSDAQGNYKLSVSASDAIIVISYAGFEEQEIAVAGRSTIDASLADLITLNVQIVGSRSYKRSSTDTPTAVDVIDVQEVTLRNGNAELNKILQYLAPSFNAQKQSGSDGAEHIDPASLRGLGPDQTLVLINGKRRHQSSLINIFGTRGRGNTGTDMNAIPASAIERIEILRDGAAAQYGSDAIAGVINIVLRSETNKLTGSVTAGGFNPIAPDEFGLYDANTPNTSGNFLDLDGSGTTTRSDDPTLDGLTTKIAANYGFDIGKKGGFANITTEFINKEKTLRPGATFRRGMGEAEISGFSGFINSVIPVGDNTEFYLFGGRNYRDTDAFAFTRNAGDDRAVPSIYPNGFTPRITSIITDNSLSAGFRKSLAGGWNADFNNTIGTNVFHYFIKGTNNATLGDRSPTDFDAGGHTLTQNTTSLDFSKYYEQGEGKGMNIAFGLEYRTDNFTIFAGEPGSYAAYDVNGLIITQPDQVSTGLAAGSQGFPGYSPANEVDRNRSNFAIYGDAEFDLSRQFLLNTALRFENYTDFGSTLNWKVASRFLASDDLTIRAAVSTGFRAPSLAQIYYNLRFTSFVNGVLTESLLSANNSPVTAGFGIQPLKQEESFNASVGFAYGKGPFTLTVDGYYIDITDRIVITGNFDASFLNQGVETAQFFANAADTRSLGLDVVLSYRTDLDNGHRFLASLAGNLNDLEVTGIKNGNLEVETFFGGREVSLLEDAAPSSKFALNLNYITDNFNINLGATNFGKVSYFSFDNVTPVEYDAKTVFDLTGTVYFSGNVNFTLGLNNIFNTYPTQQIASDNTDSGGYFDAVQMGFGGSYYFARLGFNF